MKRIRKSKILPLLLAMVMMLPLFPVTAFAVAGEYNVGDIAVINAIIGNNGLGWTKETTTDGSQIPGDWTGVVWSTGAMNKRIIDLNVPSESLSGSLDVSGLSALTSLVCSVNALTSLNVSGCSQLNLLFCEKNKLTSLNVSGCSQLSLLFCDYNKLTSLDLSGLTNIANVSGGGQTASLALSGSSASGYEVSIPLNSPVFDNTAITYAGGKLKNTDSTVTSVDFTVGTNLTGKVLSGTMSLSYNTATMPVYNVDDIEVINSIIYNNGLNWAKETTTDGSQFPSDWTGVTWSNDATNKRIIELKIFNENLTGVLDVSKLSQLQTLKCSDNQLSALNASACTGLQNLSCESNYQLNTLDVSGCTGLQTLKCHFNKLSALNVSGLNQLQTLYCGNNQLSVLNVSGCSGLQSLLCESNQLSALNVSGLSQLENLFCDSNQLSMLDLSGLSSLGFFSGKYQTVSLTLSDNSTGGYEVPIPLNSPVFDNTAVTHDGSKLKSTDSTVTSVDFTVGTNLTGKVLSGTMSLTYNTVTAPASTVDNVTVAPSNPSVPKGQTQQFNAAVTGNNNPATTVTWSVSGNSSSATVIDSNGLLTVGADETATTLTVKAVSTVDNGKSGTSTVTVTTGSVTPTTYTVTVQTDGNGTAGASPTSAAAGTEIALAATPNSGYRFKQWQIISGDIAISGNKFTMPSENVTVKAIFESAGGGGTAADTTPPKILTVKATPYGTSGAILEVTAIDFSTPLRYQWQVKGSWFNIKGATTARFDYTGLAPDTIYTVRVIVTDAAGNSATSQEVIFKTGVITDVPKTGDGSNPALYALLCLAGLCGIGVAVIMRKRKQA